MTAGELTAEAVRIQEAIAALGPMGPRRRYARELRDRIVRYVEAGVATGAKRDAVAVAAGVPPKTVDRWMRQARPGGMRDVVKAVTLAAVSIAAPSSNPGLAVVTPTGIRLEGLDVDAAVHVLRALG